MVKWLQIQEFWACLRTLEKSEKVNEMTLKTCEIMQYLEHMNPSDISVSDIERRIQSITNLKSYCLIVHDKDVKEDGSPKAPHFHAILTFRDSKTIDSIAKAVGVEPQYVSKIKGTTRSAQLYLIHRNNPEKFQYDVSAVRANFDYAEIVDDSPRKLDLKGLADSIANGTVRRYNLVNYVSVNEYAQHKRYIESCFEYRNKVLKQANGGNRQMECIFITGAAGTGKTTLAKMLCVSQNYSFYVSSGGKNPLDDYEGQDCIILDDVRPSDYKFNDFLKLTDNNTDSLVGCRFYNKSIAECKLLICTSTLSLDKFYAKLIDVHNEAKNQLLRRFSIVFELSPEYIRLSAYDPKKGCHVSFDVRVNDIALRYDPVLNSNKKHTSSLLDKLGFKGSVNVSASVSYDKIDDVFAKHGVIDMPSSNQIRTDGTEDPDDEIPF